jgi:hypothetical protein
MIKLKYKISYWHKKEAPLKKTLLRLNYLNKTHQIQNASLLRSYLEGPSNGQAFDIFAEA